MAAPKVTAETFESVFARVEEIQLPQPSGIRIMMLPVVIGSADSLPEYLSAWRDTFTKLSGMAPKHKGQIGYLTIDEKQVSPGDSHRRPAPHVDGIYQGGAGGWGGGHTGGTWGGVGNGMLTVSSPAGCRAWNQEFTGWPGYEGECDHLADQCREDACTLFEPNVVYWVDGLCVHESIPQTEEVMRQFVRLSLPSDGPWFIGYTANDEKGIMPTGAILPEREFMKA